MSRTCFDDQAAEDTVQRRMPARVKARLILYNRQQRLQRHRRITQARKLTIRRAACRPFGPPLPTAKSFKGDSQRDRRRIHQ